MQHKIFREVNANRMTDMTENGAAFRVFTHDAGGNITQEVRPGAETFDYTYNNRNRSQRTIPTSHNMNSPF